MWLKWFDIGGGGCQSVFQSNVQLSQNNNQLKSIPKFKFAVIYHRSYFVKSVCRAKYPAFGAKMWLKFTG